MGILTGTQLKNGGIILDSKEARTGFGEKVGYVVLCFIPEKSEFATWWMARDDYSTSSGNYFWDLKDAQEDFNERS